MKTNTCLRGAVVLLLSLPISAVTPTLAGEAAEPRIVGTWSLALDAGPFGIPGFALSGLATFHRDGTLIFADAGDAGSLGTLDSNQFGAWERTADGIVARALLLQAAPDTGEPFRWLRTTFRLHRGDSGDHMVGVTNIESLNCESLGLPAALTCPDPVARGDEFVPIPPFDIGIEFHRLTLPQD